ncbi:DUF2029 domain-containing protein [Rhodobacteraceae bacterium NNCM2]|nr:DUF2029 domain-containing protein [Coraliihabitans acroporae]
MKLTKDRLKSLAITQGLVTLFAWWAAITLVINYNDQDAFSIDFVAFWAAAKLAIFGDPMIVWDPQLFYDAQGAPSEDGRKMPWFYPPTFQLALSPLGILPFSIAYAVFLFASLASFRAMMLRIAPDALWFLLLSPAVCLTLIVGNATLIFASCLTYALLSLDRPKHASAAIAAMSLKPSLGPMIVPALIASGRWQVILWTSVMTIAFALLATLIFGLDYWVAFYNGTQVALARVVPGAVDSVKMISWFAFMRNIGFEEQTAFVVHFGWLIFMAIVVALVWARRAENFDWAAATLAISIPLTSPHAFHYEFVFGVVALAFMNRAGFGRVGMVVAVLLWLGPVIGIWPLAIVPLVYFAAPVLSFTFLYCALRGLRG